VEEVHETEPQIPVVLFWATWDECHPGIIGWFFNLFAGAVVSLVYVGWFIASDVLHAPSGWPTAWVHVGVTVIFAQFMRMSMANRQTRVMLARLQNEGLAPRTR